MMEGVCDIALLLRRQLGPNLGYLEQLGLLFFAGSLFCGSQSLRAIPTIFVSFAAHITVARIFLDE